MRNARTVSHARGRLAVALTIVLLSFPASALAQRFGNTGRAGAAPTFELEQTVTFAADQLIFGERLGYDVVALTDGSYLIDPGRPQVPMKVVRVALPPGMAVTGLRVVETETRELPGEYRLWPAQPYRRCSQPARADDFVAPDPQTYQQAAPYPGRLAEFAFQTDLAGQALAEVHLYPVRYEPALGRLTLHTTISFVLEGTDGYVCGDYLPANIAPQHRAAYERMICEMVLNPENVALLTRDNPPQTFGVGPGQYDYVIITQPDWMDDFQPLAEWKTRKGTPAIVVDRDWIYDEYAGGSDVADIRLFVQDAHANWGTVYFLLGGDTNTIPYHTRNILGDDIPNDTRYADYDRDWTCEVHVGRAAVRSTNGVATFISKVLTYEKDPPLSDYAKTAFFCGFDLYTRNSREGENCKRDIKSYYLPSSWTYRREYDSESGSHRSDVINYLNQGSHLINHIDHSDTDYMGVGAINHGDYLSNSDMSGLYNADRQGILYTIGCWAGNYQDNACIGESYVRNSGGGGLAFMGNSRYGWYVPYEDDQASMRYDRYFFRSLFNQSHYHLGECFSDHKNDAYQGDDYSKYIFTELNLLGDPELPIRTENPQSLTVTHEDTLIAGELNAVTVQVRSGGSPLQSATVCLYKPGDVYEVQQTNASGIAAFAITPTSPGTLYVTASHRNYLPYEGSAEVVESGGETCLPTGYTVVAGQQVSGGLSDLFESDDSRLVLTHSGFYPPWIELEVVTTATTATPDTLTFTFEGHVTGEQVEQSIRLYNYSNGFWEEHDVRTAPLSDTVVEITISSNAARFVDPATRQMKSRIRWIGTGFANLYGWDAKTDQTIWVLEP